MLSEQNPPTPRMRPSFHGCDVLKTGTFVLDAAQTFYISLGEGAMNLLYAQEGISDLI